MRVSVGAGRWGHTVARDSLAGVLGREERGGDAALVPTDGPALSFVRRDRGLRGSACWAWRGKRRERAGPKRGEEEGKRAGWVWAVLLGWVGFRVSIFWFSFLLFLSYFYSFSNSTI